MRAWKSCGLLTCLVAAWGIESAAAGPGSAREEGKRLFARVWEPNDPRAHGGDGLGPVYNERSCVACHAQGGVGGAGPNDKNVEILSASRNGGDFSCEDREKLGVIHVDLAAAASVVIHRFGTDPQHEAWRSLWGTIVTDRGFAIGPVALRITRRNTPALFGAGLIDDLPEVALEAMARRNFPKFPEVKGRLHRLEDGRIGRFGWKAQTASLKDFVLTACSNELGLEVPDHHQARAPRGRDGGAPGLDLTDAECAALTAYTGRLPAPIRRAPATAEEGRFIEAGEATFKAIGCTTCHAQTVGSIEGIYSDLLLHDLGDRLSGSGSYGHASSGSGLASEDREWRTPPLWGVADSAPYMHDGRAPTLEKAIELHGGQAGDSASRFARLDRHRRETVMTFLDSLAAPHSPARPVKTVAALDPPR